MSGSIANLTPNTGYEPKCDVDNDTPVIFPDTDDHEPNLSTVFISEGDQTKFGSRQAARTVFNPSRVCVDPSTGRPVQRERERERSSHYSVSEQTQLRDNSSVVSVEGSMLWGKRNKNDESATLIDRQNLHEFLERQAQTTVLGEQNSQRKLTEAESDMENKEWERRNSEFALYESQCEPESQRQQLRQASQWAEQALRERISLCGEFELKNRLHQESDTRSRQEFEELRRRCNRGDKLAQHRLDECSVQQKRDPDTVSRLIRIK